MNRKAREFTGTDLLEAVLGLPDLKPLEQLIVLHLAAGISRSEISYELHTSERILKKIEDQVIKKLRKTLSRLKSEVEEEKRASSRPPGVEAAEAGENGPTGEDLTSTWRSETIAGLREALSFVVGERKPRNRLRDIVPTVLDFSESAAECEKIAEKVLSEQVPEVSAYRIAKECCFEALRKGDLRSAPPLTSALSKLASSAGLTELKWEARFYAAITARRSGEISRALGLLDPLCERHQVPDRLRMKVLFELGTILSECNEPSRALKLSQKALVLAREFVDISSMGKIYNLMGILYKELGRFDLSEQALSTCDRIATQIQDEWMSTLVAGNLAWLLVIRRRAAAAESAIQRARYMARQSNHTRALIVSGLHLTQLRLQQKRHGEALQEAQKTQQLAADEDMERYLDVLWFSKLQDAEIHRRLGNAALAETARQEAATIQKRHTNVSVRDLSFSGARVLLLTDRIRRAIEERGFLELNKRTGELRFIPAG